MELLHKMEVEDSQWVVKDAASHALAELAMPNPFVPHPFPALSNTPWLIVFAGERGVGIAPGKPAMDLVLQAVREGNEDQRLAALAFLETHGRASAVLPCYHSYYGERGELRECAYRTIWHLGTGGVPLPPPVQYGLGK